MAVTAFVSVVAWTFIQPKEVLAATCGDFNLFEVARLSTNDPVCQKRGNDFYQAIVHRGRYRSPVAIIAFGNSAYGPHIVVSEFPSDRSVGFFIDGNGRVSVTSGSENDFLLYTYDVEIKSALERLARIEQARGVVAFTGAGQTCRVTDPTGTPLNVRDSPNGNIINALRNGREVEILESSYDGQRRQWVRIAGYYEGNYRIWGWAIREFIGC